MLSLILEITPKQQELNKIEYAYLFRYTEIIVYFINQMLCLNKRFSAIIS